MGAQPTGDDRAKGEGNHGSWRDWWPPGVPLPTDTALITRAELLGQLAARNVAVDERTLRHWQQRGALPPPWRRWHEGRVQALYPPWFAEVVIALAQLRAHLPLRRVVGYGRTLFADFARMHTESQQTEAAIERMEKPFLPDSVRAALSDYLDAHGGGTAEVAVQLRDGRRHTASVTTTAPRPAPPTD